MSSKNISTEKETVPLGTTVPKKIGFVRFCQVRDLKGGIAAIMKTRYATQVHTLSEWDALLESVLKSKV